MLRGGNLQSLVDEPRALVVLDVSADLANVLGQAEVVQVVVLDLEVLSKGDEDILGGLKVLRGGDVELVEGKGDGEVEGVVRRLEDNDELVLLQGEVVEVDLVFGSSDEVDELAKLGLEASLVEKVDEIDVGGVRAEVLPEEDVNGSLKDDGVVDGNHADTLVTVPAGLAAAGDAAVHDIVGDEEEGLEQLGQPAQGSGLEVLLLGKRGAEEDGDRVGHGHAAVAFSAQGVDFEILSTNSG